MNILNKEQTKNRLISLTLIIAMIFSLLAMFKTTETAHAEELKPKTVLIDLDGKGAKESVTFQPAGYNGEMYVRLDVYINGEKKLSLPDSYGYLGYSYKRYKLANGKIFLLLRLAGYNGNGPHRLYQYTGGKLKCKLRFQLKWCGIIEKVRVKGNSLVTTMRYGDIPGLGATAFRTIYVYKSGKFKIKSKIHNIIYYLNYKSKQVQCKPRAEKVIESFAIYKDKSCKKKLKKVPVGAKVKPTKIYINGITSVYVKSKKYSGWYFAYGTGAISSQNPAWHNAHWGPYFDGPHGAG